VKLTLVGAVLASTGLSLAVWAQDRPAVVPAAVEAAARAMGAIDLQSIQYSGTGSVFLVGQAHAPGGPWPRFELPTYVASVNYASLAMREETVRRDVERPPRGGGAGPFNPATGQGGMRPIPGDVVQTIVRDGRTEIGALPIWMTPHGFLKAALASQSVLVTERSYQGRMAREVVFSVGPRTLSGLINDQNLLERVATMTPHGLLGQMPVETLFSDYKDYGPVRFPARIVQLQGGHPTLELDVARVEPNSAAASAVTSPAPRLAPGPSAPVTTGLEKIVDGVWFLTGGAPMSVLVEFSDHVVVIEAPQSDERSAATVAAVRQAMPGKPIRYVVSTHHHFDHAGGVRGYAADGIPIIVHERGRDYLQQLLTAPFTLEPDRLARSGRKGIVETVGDRRVLRDDRMTLELIHLRDHLHAETLLVGHLPKQKLLVQADAFHPRPGAAPLPAPPPFTINLVDNVRRLKLDVERVVHVHGGVDSWATVVKAAGRE
jgi:glyoxylase-like metal-dependent hydrolase (beta-lactamase superfamily II)